MNGCSFNRSFIYLFICPSMRSVRRIDDFLYPRLSFFDFDFDIEIYCILFIPGKSRPGGGGVAWLIILVSKCIHTHITYVNLRYTYTSFPSNLLSSIYSRLILSSFHLLVLVIPYYSWIPISLLLIVLHAAPAR